MSQPDDTASSQSPTLFWTVLSHILVLPLLDFFLPGIVRAVAAQFALQPADGDLLVVFVLATVGLHGVLWRQARREGKPGLAVAVAVLLVLSLAGLALFGDVAPVTVATVLFGQLT